MSPDPLDYATPGRKPRLPSAIKWILIVLLLLLIGVVTFVTYMWFYIGSFGPMPG